MAYKIATLKSVLPGVLQNLLGLSQVDTWVDMTSFNNLADAVNAIGLNEAILVISSATSVGQSNLLVPSNISLQFLPGGSLDISSGETVTVHGEILAGDTQQIKTGSGVLAFANPRRISVNWFGVKAATATEQNSSLKEACQALQTAGGGHLYFPPGIYRFYNDGGSNDWIFNFNDLTGITITGYSAVLELDPIRDWKNPPSSANFFAFSNCHNIFIDGFEGTGPNIIQDGLYPYSVAFSRFEKGCSNIHIPFLRLQGWQAAVIASRPMNGQNHDISRGFTLGQIEVKGCTYGINFQRSGHDTTLDLLRTENVYRSFFIYGTENIEANIISCNPKGRDVNMSAVSKVDENFPLRNIKVKYTNLDSNESENKMAVWLYFWGHCSPGIIEDIDLDINIRYGNPCRRPMGSALWISKMDNDLNTDLGGTRGHILRNVQIKAFTDGQESNDSSEGGAVIRTQNGCDWTGETWSNVIFKDITIVNNTNGISMAIDPRANTDVLTFRNVVLPGALDLWGSSQLSPTAPARGKLIIDAVHCSNLNQYSNNSLPVRMIELLQDQYSIPIGWQGLTFSNPGAFTTTEYNLPLATAGLEYSFVRVAPGQIIRIDPDGNDVIRGGGSGKYLSLDSDGCFVTLHCYISGYWEIIDKSGMTSFEP